MTGLIKESLWHELKQDSYMEIKKPWNLDLIKNTSYWKRRKFFHVDYDSWWQTFPNDLNKQAEGLDT